MDFFERNGVAAVASRLRRLTERLTRDDAELYKSAGLNFKPKWFPVYLTLAEGRARTVAAIAKEIGQTHPSVSVIASEMRKAGLIESGRTAPTGEVRNCAFPRRRSVFIRSFRNFWATSRRPLFRSRANRASTCLRLCASGKRLSLGSPCWSGRMKSAQRAWQDESESSRGSPNGKAISSA